MHCTSEVSNFPLAVEAVGNTAFIVLWIRGMAHKPWRRGRGEGREGGKGGGKERVRERRREGDEDGGGETRRGGETERAKKRSEERRNEMKEEERGRKLRNVVSHFTPKLKSDRE